MNINTALTFLTNRDGKAINPEYYEEMDPNNRDWIQIQFQTGEKEFFEIGGESVRQLREKDARNRNGQKYNKFLYVDDHFCNTCPPYLQEWIVENEYTIVTASDCPATFEGSWVSQGKDWKLSNPNQFTQLNDENADNYTLLPYVALEFGAKLLVTDAQTKLLDEESDWLESIKKLQKVYTIDSFNQTLLESAGIDSEIV